MRILAIGAHLDDLEVACGGTLAAAAARGHAVRMLILSNSAYTNVRGEVLRTADQALAEGRAAARELGVADLQVLDFPCKDVPADEAVVGAIAEHLAAFGPTMVLTHHPYDSHQAHVGTAKATLEAGAYRYRGDGEPFRRGGSRTDHRGRRPGGVSGESGIPDRIIPRTFLPLQPGAHP